MDKFNEDYKPLYAAYYNQARHNLFLVLNDIAIKVGLAHQGDDGELKTHSIFSALSNNKNARRELKIIQAINKSLPFIPLLGYRLISLYGTEEQKKKNSVDNTEPLTTENYKQILENLTSILHDLRNEMSHYGQETPTLDYKFVKILDAIFDAAYRTIKERHKYPQEEIVHLRRRDGNHRDGSSKNNPKFKYHLFEEGADQFTQDGLIFFCCLFLSKQEGYQFLKQIPGFKNENTRPFRATLKLFTCFSIKLPFVRIIPESNKQTLALDMLNELARCPKNLYKHLPSEIQEDYQISIDELEETEDESEKTDEIYNTIPFIRHNERFIPLMLQYFDQTEAFEQLRFQIDIGDFYFAAYPKTLYPTHSEFCTEEIRRLKKKLLCFARLNDLQSANSEESPPYKTEEWKRLEKQKTEVDEAYPLPYIVQTQPHYHLEDDSIALKLVDTNECYPAIKGLDQENPPQRYQSPNNESAEFYISRHEIMNMGFYHLLRNSCEKLKNKTPAVENLLKKYKASMMKIYRAIQEGTELKEACANTPEELNIKLTQFSANGGFKSISSQDLPTVLRNYLLGKPPYGNHKDKAINAINKQIEDTEKRSEQLKKQKLPPKRENQNRAGEREQRVLKSGEMADFIARDILRFQPPSPNEKSCGKANSLLFAELQARLAFYGRDKHMLKTLCQDMRLIKSSNEHPFLPGLINKPESSGIADFYGMYLNEKKRYLTDILQKTTKNTAEIKKHHWLQQETEQSTQQTIKQYIENIIAPNNKFALNLPRGLFLTPVKNLILLLEHAELKKVINGRKVNTTHLIQLYYQYILEDQYQQVYTHKRRYRLIDQAYDERTRKQKFNSIGSRWVQTQQPYSAKEQAECFKRLRSWLTNQQKGPLNKKGHQETLEIRKTQYRQFEKNEKNIRQTRTQDQVLFLATKELLSLAEQNQPHELKLKNIAKDILTQSVSYQISLHGKKIETPSIKLKNIGDFRRLLKDRRLEGFLSYFKQECIDYDYIRLELEHYTRQRIEAFKHILAFEKNINSFLTKAEKNEMESPANGNRHSLLLKYHFKRHPMADRERQEKLMHSILILRNAFSHNQYPDSRGKYIKQYYLAQEMLECAKEVFLKEHKPRIADYFTKKLIEFYQMTNEQYDIKES